MRNSKIYIAGHSGLVGSALLRRLADFQSRIVLRSHAELDLRSQSAVEEFFKDEKPDYVFLAAGKVGGIVANSSYPADFALDTLQIQTNVIDAAFRHGCRKLMFLGSSCIYPKLCPQPIKEDYLLTGPLEPTNEGFAVAKIAGLMMCRAYRRQYGFDAIAAMPGNLYGPGDNFDLENGHVLPSMLRRVHEAKKNGDKSVTIWGSGTPLREFIHVDDIADGCVFLMEKYSGADHINIGSGFEISMLELAHRIAAVVGFKGDILTDPEKPDGTPRKIMDSSRMQKMGWSPSIQFNDGLADTYRWYQKNETSGKVRK